MWSNVPAAHASHPTTTRCLHQRSPTRVIRALREREAQSAIRLICALAGRRLGGRRGGRRVRSGVLCMLLLVLLELLLRPLGASGDVSVLVGEDTHGVGSDFVMDNRLVIFAYDIDPEFLLDLSDEYTGGRLGYVRLRYLISIHRIRSRDLLG
jgi:hypothetical protein